VPCSRQRDWRPGRAGYRGPACGARSPAPARAPAPPAGGTTAGSPGDLHTAADPGHSPRPPATRYRPFGVSSRVMGALMGPEPAQGGLGPAGQPGAANDRERAGSPADRFRPGKATAEVPESRSRVKSGQAAPGAASGPGISPVSPRNAAPDRAPGMIEGHQGRTAPILTRDHDTSADYRSICSIYPVRFAVSGAAVARLTRDRGPSATGTFRGSRERARTHTIPGSYPVGIYRRADPRS
jgi:hypothetical protein